MSIFLAQTAISVASGDGEDSFWIQILVFLLLAASWGVYNLVKKKPNRFKQRDMDAGDEYSYNNAKARWQFQLSGQNITQSAGIGNKSSYVSELPEEMISDSDHSGVTNQQKPESISDKESKKDLQSGMELLELYFLLSVVENTEGDDGDDVAMRKLNFNELLRRGKLNQVSSKALKAYVINQNIYGKDIQCEAIKELAERTIHKE